MATTIAHLTEKDDGSLEGVFATLKISVPINVVPIVDKPHPEGPDWRVINKRTGFEMGAAWKGRSRTSGRDTVSYKFAAPEINTLYGNLAPAPGGDERQKVVLWNDNQ